MTYRKKLIEVALPLDDINAESAQSTRYDHPSTLLEEPKIYTVLFRVDHSHRFGGGRWSQLFARFPWRL